MSYLQAAAERPLAPQGPFSRCSGAFSHSAWSSSADGVGGLKTEVQTSFLTLETDHVMWSKAPEKPLNASCDESVFSSSISQHGQEVLKNTHLDMDTSVTAV